MSPEKLSQSYANFVVFWTEYGCKPLVYWPAAAPLLIVKVATDESDDLGKGSAAQLEGRVVVAWPFKGNVIVTRRWPLWKVIHDTAAATATVGCVPSDVRVKTKFVGSSEAVGLQVGERASPCSQYPSMTCLAHEGSHHKNCSYAQPAWSLSTHSLRCEIVSSPKKSILRGFVCSIFFSMFYL